MAEKESKNKWHTPAERIMMLGFAAVILLGTILLCLPVSAADGKSVYWLDALFTATTSVCVTGLVTVPTATTWSTFGKIVILGLIQFGGLGIMACLTMVFLILRRKISLQSRKLIQDTYNLPVLKGSVGIVRKLLIGTAAVAYRGQTCDRERRHSMGLLSPRLTTGTRQAWQRRQGFYRYLNVAALPCSLIPTPPDDEQSPGIFHLQEDFE